MYSQKIAHALGLLLALVVPLHTSTIVLAKESGQKMVQESGVEQAIRQLEKGRVQALLSNDTTFMERNYADDYMTTGANGLVRDRAQVIADLKSGAIKYESMTHDDVRLRVYGNTVIVTGLDTNKGVEKGEDISGQRRFTRVWVKQDGRWLLVANQTTRVP